MIIKTMLATSTLMITSLILTTTTLNAATGPNYSNVQAALMAENTEKAKALTLQIENVEGIQGLVNLKNFLFDRFAMSDYNKLRKFLPFLITKITPKPASPVKSTSQPIQSPTPNIQSNQPPISQSEKTPYPPVPVRNNWMKK